MFDRYLLDFTARFRIRSMALPALAASSLIVAATLQAQPSGPARPGESGESVAFEVQSIDRATWVVTARDLESGEAFTFRLPPESFRGQRFDAELEGAAAGRKVTVKTPPQVVLDRAVIERPVGIEGRPGRDATGEEGWRRQGRPEAEGYRLPTGRSGPPRRGGSGAAPSGPASYEVISVDPRTWEVEARASDGATVVLEVDPKAFVGFRFEAAVDDLKAGQGFQLLATHDRPLADCCVVKSRGIRR